VMTLGEHQPVSEDQQELSTVDVLVQELENLDRSHDSNFRIKIQFVNATRTTVSIRWLDFDGAEVTYSNLQPGARLPDGFRSAHEHLAPANRQRCNTANIQPKIGQLLSTQ